MICNKWVNKMKRNGADPEAIQTKRARNCITLVATSMHNLKYDKIPMLIKPLFEQLLNLLKLRKLNAQIKDMQKKMVDKMEGKKGRVDVLTNYWDKMLY